MLKNLLTDIAGVRVGHADDRRLASGVTAIVFDTPAVAAIDIQKLADPTPVPTPTTVVRANPTATDATPATVPPTATALASTLSPAADEQNAGRDAGDPTRIWLVGLAAVVLLGGGLLARRLVRH